MRIEREGINPQYPSYLYCLPDGLVCNWTYLPSDIKSAELLDIGEKLAFNATKSQVQERICISSLEYLIVLGNHLVKDGYDAHWGGNKFFEINLKSPEQIEVEYPNINWFEYKHNFAIERVDANNPFDRQILLSLMVGSFGHVKIDDKFILHEEKYKKILERFNVSLNDKTNLNFLVRGFPNANEVLGAFTLKCFPDLSEVQLHSVAGMSTHKGVIKKGKKLAILMAGVFAAIENEFPQSRQFGIGQRSAINYTGIKKLTFSASNVAQNYINLGLPTSDRNGLVIYP